MVNLSPSDVRQSEPVGLPTERQCPFDPPSELSEIRDRQPLSRFRFPDGHVGWLVTSNELVRAVLGDQRFSRVPSGSHLHHPERQAAVLFDAIQDDTTFPDAVRAVVERYEREGRLTDAFRDPEVVRTLHEHPLTKMPYSNMDPPAHTRMRRLLTGHFAVRNVAKHRPLIEQIVADCLDTMEEVGPPVDLVEKFAIPIPSRMSCALLGVPESDRATLERLSAVRIKPGATTDDILEGNAEFRAFAQELVERKRAKPADDLISALIDNGEMSEDELVSAAVLLHLAANLTTSSTLAYAVATLLKDRDQWNMLRSGSIDIGRVVEELVRYTTAGQDASIRTALEDVEIGGTVIKAFETVAISLPPANRDPKVFADPDRLDLTRQASRHLAFGYGVHQCLGQQLVRLELQIALTGLARRFPTLDLAVPVTDIAWPPSGDANIYGPRKLPVTWSGEN